MQYTQTVLLDEQMSYRRILKFYESSKQIFPRDFYYTESLENCVDKFVKGAYITFLRAISILRCNVKELILDWIINISCLKMHAKTAQVMFDIYVSWPSRV